MLEASLWLTSWVNASGFRPTMQKSHFCRPKGRRALKDIYAVITDRFIEQLKQGTVPWQKPWTGAQNIVGAAGFEGGGPCSALVAKEGGAVAPVPAGGGDRGAVAAGAEAAAELTGLNAHVQGDLLHAVVEDPYVAVIPVHPDLSPNHLRRGLVIRLGHFHVAVAVDTPTGFLIAREKRGG